MKKHSQKAEIDNKKRKKEHSPLPEAVATKGIRHTPHLGRT